MKQVCSVEDCVKQASRRNTMCNFHYRRSIGKPCAIDDCVGHTVAKKLCGKHYQRLMAGRPMDHERAVGRIYMSPDGYIVEYEKSHIQSDKDGKVLQHRRVMSDHLGRKLEPYENVHHKNGNRSDNRLENLELWVKKQPAGQRVEDLIEYAQWILKEYNDK